MTSLYAGIAQQIKEGRQVYIVFPVIEEGKKRISRTSRTATSH